MTDRTPRHFNENDELTSDVNNPSVSTDQGLADLLRINDPTNYVNSTTGQNTPAVIQSNDANRALALQSKTNNKPDPGYSATIDFLGANGIRAARLSGDMADQHLHVYIKSDTEGDGDTQPRPHTRFEARPDMTTLDVGDVEEGDTRIIIRPGSQNTASSEGRLVFMNDTGDKKSDIRYTSNNNLTRMFDWDNNRTVWEYNPEFQVWDWMGTQQVGLREISNPTASSISSQEWAWDSTDSRWLYKDSGGTAHYFTPDGTL